MANVTQEEAVAALNKALAEERGENQPHDHGHQDATKAGGCEDGACEHGHGDEHGLAEKKQKSTDHGHADHSTEDGHADHSGCCGGEHDHSEHGHSEHGHDGK